MRVILAALAFSFFSFAVGVAGDLSARGEAQAVAQPVRVALPPMLQTPVAAAIPFAAEPLQAAPVTRLEEPPRERVTVKLRGKFQPLSLVKDAGK